MKYINIITIIFIIGCGEYPEPMQLTSDSDTFEDASVIDQVDSSINDSGVLDLDSGSIVDSGQTEDSGKEDSGIYDSGTDSSVDASADTDIDIDTDVDGDSDMDMDVDTDIDTDSDTDIDTDSDSDMDIDSDTDIDIDSDSDTDSDSDSDIDTDTDNDVDTDTDSNTEIDCDGFIFENNCWRLQNKDELFKKVLLENLSCPAGQTIPTKEQMQALLDCSSDICFRCYDSSTCSSFIDDPIDQGAFWTSESCVTDTEVGSAFKPYGTNILLYSCYSDPAYLFCLEPVE